MKMLLWKARSKTRSPFTFWQVFNAHQTRNRRASDQAKIESKEEKIPDLVICTKADPLWDRLVAVARFGKLGFCHKGLLGRLATLGGQ